MHFAFGVGNMSVEEEDVLIAERVSGPRRPRKEVMVATWATRHLGTSYLSSPSIAPGASTTNNARVLTTPPTKYAMSDNKKQERKNLSKAPFVLAVRLDTLVLRKRMLDVGEKNNVEDEEEKETENQRCSVIFG